MGGKTTKLFKSSHQEPFTRNQGENLNENYSQYHEQPQASATDGVQPDEMVVKSYANPFVHYRKGSMYMDEDGDLAHEFYVETKQGANLTLKQISNNVLTPQGDVLLDVPCLRNDYPVILLDQSKVKE